MCYLLCYYLAPPRRQRCLSDWSRFHRSPWPFILAGPQPASITVVHCWTFGSFKDSRTWIDLAYTKQGFDNIGLELDNKKKGNSVGFQKEHTLYLRQHNRRAILRNVQTWTSLHQRASGVLRVSWAWIWSQPRETNVNRLWFFYQSRAICLIIHHVDCFLSCFYVDLCWSVSEASPAFLTSNFCWEPKRGKRGILICSMCSTLSTFVLSGSVCGFSVCALRCFT